MYVILNTRIKDNSFLKAQLGISDYVELYISKKTLIQDLKDRLEFLAEAKILLTNKPVNSFYELANVFDKNLLNFNQLNPSDAVFYFDLNLFPCNFELFDNLIQKTEYSEDPVIFIEHNTEKLTLPIFKVQVKDLVRNSNDEQMIFSALVKPLEVNVDKLFISLDSTQNLLQLFSSNFEPRFFNHIRSEENYFVKSSSKIDKMQAEFNFLANIPAVLRSYFPQVGQFKEESKQASYQIEKVFMLDLSKQLINKVLNNETVVDSLLARLKSYLESCPSHKVSKEDFARSYNKEIINKNEQRFEDMKQLDIYPKLNQLAIFRGYASCEEVYAAINDALKHALENLKGDELLFSHGDLCFSNILFDKNTASIKLIDPKGFNKSQDETYRTRYYDLAKLSHSFVGLYDLIIYDLVDIQVNQDGVLSLNYLIDSKYRELLRTKFENFIKEIKADYKLVRLVEASLFLSMIPLHQDIPKKMLAQFMQAIESFEESKLGKAKIKDFS